MDELDWVLKVDPHDHVEIAGGRFKHVMQAVPSSSQVAGIGTNGISAGIH